ncbi:hypothetical protein [Burkholderia pseudomallei]|uniref:hypothetical protein n=1 Tax=Burkholderia pseudomallei TaxID=28450 RepID=UPI0002F053DE|nr:hypothetical protein [Burkholderia pseudomallei]MCD4519724.1 hypothetical protein [Burkholderia pseudomallei]MCW0133342.1 hypothetical protein [Burkholderia pseudomallei]MDS1023337.1 hypothetical protein [Burkholderia pseudomallei]
MGSPERESRRRHPMGGECRVESGPGTRAYRVKSTTWSAATLIYFSSFRDASPSAGVGAMAATRDDARRDDGVGCGAGRHVGGASARRAGGFTILRFDSRTAVPALTDERIGGAAAYSKRVFADVCVSMSIVLPIRSTDSFSVVAGVGGRPPRGARAVTMSGRPSRHGGVAASMRALRALCAPRSA